MKTVRMSATQARNNFFDIINAAHYGGQVTIITKNGEEVARVKAKKEKKFDWDKYLESVKTLGSFLTDEDVKEYKQIRKELNKPRFPDW